MCEINKLRVDAADSKSVAGNGVLVQVRPGAPFLSTEGILGKGTAGILRDRAPAPQLIPPRWLA